MHLSLFVTALLVIHTHRRSLSLVRLLHPPVKPLDISKAQFISESLLSASHTAVPVWAEVELNIADTLSAHACAEMKVKDDESWRCSI